jgi:nucleoside-diphosphate-sugar epimerase
MTKAIGELLVAEASRRGFVDGRTARLPTVIVRPGRPNLAASSFASGLFREPLAGVATVVPVATDTGVVVIGHRTAVDGLARLLALPPGALGPDRAVGLPGLSVTVADMLAALTRAGARHGRQLGPVEVRPDPAISAIVASWPARWDHGAALALGLEADRSLDEIVDAYLADFGGG